MSNEIPLRPLYNRVTVKVLEDPTEGAGGLTIPESARGRDGLRRGRIVAVGRDSKPDDLQVGQVIVFGRHIGEVTRWPGLSPTDDSYVTMRQDDPVAVEE